MGYTSSNNKTLNARLLSRHKFVTGATLLQLGLYQIHNWFYGTQMGGSCSKNITLVRGKLEGMFFVVKRAKIQI
jgi:hypothetical protein